MYEFIDPIGVAPQYNNTLPGSVAKNHIQVHPLFLYFCLIQKASI